MTDTGQASGMPLPEAMAGNFQDAMRWFSQLWAGGMDPSAPGRSPAGAVPSMMMPTLDVNELEKRIADLRSVENWLGLNLSLLRTTIQGLEMQRSTLTAWQALGKAGSPAAPGAPAPGGAASASTDNPAFQPALWWSALQQNFAQMAASAAASAAAQDSAVKEAAASAPTASAAPRSTGRPKNPGPAAP